METSEPKLTVLRTDVDACHTKLDIEVPAVEVNRRLDDALALYGKSARVPGFRPGKVPRAILLGRFGAQIAEQAKSKLLEDGVQQACKMENLEPETTPRIDNEEAVHVLADSPFVFSVSFDIAPQFDLPKYKGIEATRIDTAVTDDSIEQAIEGLLRQRTKYEKVERPSEAGDLLKVTYKSTLLDDGPEIPEAAKFFLEAEATWLTLSVPEIIPGTIAAMTGIEPGAVRELDVEYPAEFAEESLRGRKAHYSFEVLEVHAAQVPKFTDEMARELGAEDADEARGRLRQNMEYRQTREQDESVRRQIVEALLDKADFSLPPILLRRETQQAFGRIVEESLRRGQSEEEVKSQHQQLLELAGRLATRQLRRYYLMRRIAEQEEIQVDGEEVGAAIAALSQQHGIAHKVMLRRLRDSGRIADVVISLRESKAIERLVSLATVTTKEAEAETDEEAEKQS